MYRQFRGIKVRQALRTTHCCRLCEATIELGYWYKVAAILINNHRWISPIFCVGHTDDEIRDKINL